MQGPALGDRPGWPSLDTAGGQPGFRGRGATAASCRKLAAWRAYSVAEVLEKLEKRIAFHREQADHHAQQEIHHREQNAFHLGELKRVTEHFEAFKGTALPAAELAGEATAPPPPVQKGADGDSALAGKDLQASKLVAKVVEGMPDGASFGAAQVAAEANRRYRDKLRRPLDARYVSVTLRRLREGGRLRLVREGKSNQEALYAKRPRPAAAKPASGETLEE